MRKWFPDTVPFFWGGWKVGWDWLVSEGEAETDFIFTCQQFGKVKLSNALLFCRTFLLGGGFYAHNVVKNSEIVSSKTDNSYLN